jgi:DNA-binding PadR family transcriptional regulator
MRGGVITFKVLNHLKKFSRDINEMFPILFGLGYGASFSKIQKRLVGGDFNLNNDNQKEEKRKFSKLLYKLKKDGLIQVVNKNGRGLFQITKIGKEKLIKLKQSKIGIYSYVKEKSNNTIIVVFDIPEKDKKKRDWLRSVLISLDFEMIQKSVWLGKTKIPEDFLSDLKEFNIIKFVEVFEISKGGTLNVIF